jgi:hypothetical protein
LKNIAEPIHVYSLEVGQPAKQSLRPQRRRRISRSRPRPSRVSVPNGRSASRRRPVQGRVSGGVSLGEYPARLSWIVPQFTGRVQLVLRWFFGATRMTHA